MVVNLAVGGYAGCVLLWKLGSGENVCTVGRRVERNGLAALGGCHSRIDTVLRGIMLVKAISSQLIEGVLCVAVSGMFFALVSTLVSRSEWFFQCTAKLCEYCGKLAFGSKVKKLWRQMSNSIYMVNLSISYHSAAMLISSSLLDNELYWSCHAWPMQSLAP